MAHTTMTTSQSQWMKAKRENERCAAEAIDSVKRTELLARKALRASDALPAVREPES